VDLKQPQLQALAGAAAATHERELDCDEFLAQMAALAEHRASAGSQPLAPPDGLVLAARHERLCANCREELAALQRALGRF
jgi:hypothetical protein